MKAIPELGIEKLDRMQPSVDLRDVHEFENAPVPILLTIWRGKDATMKVLRESPLLQIEGVSLEPRL